MKKTLTVLIISAMTVLFAVGCTTEDATPETPAETPVETPAETPAEEPSEVSVTSLVESRELSADEQASLEKVVRFMRTVDDTVQVALFEMTEADGGFNMELVVKNNFADTTTVTEGTIISVTTQSDEVIEIPVPMDLEIESNSAVLFETKVETELLKSRSDIYFIEFKAEETAE